MSDNYVCPQCGAEYDAPGVCESCQVALQAPDEVDELEGFQTDEEEDEEEDDEEEEGALSEEDFSSEEGEEETKETSEYATDTYEDSDNY